MQYIYILNDDGKPLMPTKREHHINKLIKQHKAKIVSHVPFVVQLLYHSEGITLDLFGGNDPGRTNLGFAVVDGNGNVVYLAKVESRNKEIVRLMNKRRAHRRASRTGRRKVWKRLAKKFGTTMKAILSRRLPGYSNGGTVCVKDIINKEARFLNRKRLEGWLTPSARQLVQTHINMVKKIMKILPVSDWTEEVNRFAFMKMDDGSVYGSNFQNGRLKGYKDGDAFVYARQSGKCYCCGKPIEHYHHIIPRSEYGSDLPENKIGVCEACHHKIHTGKIMLDVEGIRKKYGALSVLNQAMPSIMRGLYDIFGMKHLSFCFGYQTKEFRETSGLDKDHDLDAVCIACLSTGLVPNHDMPNAFFIKQFRRHNRAIINNQRERTYYLDGKVVCKNRHKREAQKCDSLEEFRQEHLNDVCKLTVKKSQRYYNSSNRIMPGAVFYYGGKRYVMSGQLANGYYFRAVGEGKRNFPVAKCKIVLQNTGLVYVR